MTEFTLVINEVYLSAGIIKCYLEIQIVKKLSITLKKITHLQNKQLDFWKLSKEQITAVSTTLRSIHSTLLKSV
jgi:hypothetical protein